MLLSPRHDRRAVHKPLTLRAIQATPWEILVELRALCQPGGDTDETHELLRDRAASFGVEDFARRYMHVRDDLAWRAARGLPLTEIERATLHGLDAILDSLEGPPPALPREIQDILRDLKPR